MEITGVNKLISVLPNQGLLWFLFSVLHQDNFG